MIDRRFPKTARSAMAAALAAFALAAFALGVAPAVAGGGHSHDHGHKHSATGGVIEGIQASAAVSPAAAPGITTSAVYLMLANKSGTGVDLVGVESPAFAMAHFHKTSMVNGLMSMEPVAQLALPADATVMFEPGGLHIMLMGAKTPLKAGESFSVSLLFGTGEKLEVPVSVVKPGDLPVHDHGAMHTN